MVDNDTPPAGGRRRHRDRVNNVEDHHYRRQKSQKTSSYQHGHGHHSAVSNLAGAESFDDPVLTFDAMNLKPNLLRGIYSYGYEKPSAIQQRAIRPIVQGRDVIAQSQSGTGPLAA
jgi:hypothetical protein